MKKIALKLVMRTIVCFLFASIFQIISTSCSMTPHSLVRSTHFVMYSPEEKNWWSSITNTDSTEMISLERGSLSGNLNIVEPDPPMRWIYIIRKQIPSEFKNEEQIKDWFQNEAQEHFKREVDHLENDSVIYAYNSYEDKYYYSSAYRTRYYKKSDPVTTALYGYGIAQFTIYLPKYYREWEAGYLILFVSYPYPSYSPDYQISVDKPNYLFEVLNKFKCVEDLKDKKQEIKWSERWY